MGFMSFSQQRCVAGIRQAVARAYGTREADAGDGEGHRFRRLI